MDSALNNASVVLALAMAFGVVAQGIARHANVPGIVILLLFGVLLGPDVANVIRPEAMGAGLKAVVGFAVAIILFEGGLNLNIKHLVHQALPIRRLVTVGAVVTALGGAIAAKLFMGWGWQLSFLFGTLVIVTGPTVITPLLRRIKVRHNVEIILEAEGIFIDAVGATIAVVALEVVLAPRDETLGKLILGVLGRVGVGTAVGLIGGAILAVLLRWKKVVPEGLHNILSLAMAVATFHIADGLQHEAGIIAAIVAGMVVGNTRSYVLKELKHFQDQLTILLIATLFVLLAADVRMSDVQAVGLPGVGCVLFLMFVVRPATVFASTYKTNLETREKLFLSWLGPRGIVAAAVASLFATALAGSGDFAVADAKQMQALVFLVIALTVVLQGGTGQIVADLLKVRRKQNEGYLLLGANGLGRRFGDLLRSAGESVMFIDANAKCCQKAEAAGFEVFHGNALDDDVLAKVEAESRIACIGITPSEDTNFLFARRVHEGFRGPELYVALETEEKGVTDRMVVDEGHHVLFGTEFDLRIWAHHFEWGDAAVERWRYGAEADDILEVYRSPGGIALPMAAFRKGRILLIEQTFKAQVGDVVEFAVVSAHADEAHAWLSAGGWQMLHRDKRDREVAEDASAATPGAGAPVLLTKKKADEPDDSIKPVPPPNNDSEPHVKLEPGDVEE